MSARIHYVVGAYVGSRLHVDEQAAVDPWRFLREHVANLWELRHNLARVTVMLNTDEPVELPRFLQLVEVVQRQNVGLSYGAFSHAFDEGGDFTHWLFTEDDYVFTQDRFDEILLDEYERAGGHLLTGTAYASGADRWRHGAVQPHFASTEVWQAVAEARGGHLPFDESNNIRASGMFGQKELSFAAAEAGHEAVDFLGRWSTAYRSGEGQELNVRWFSRPNGDQGCAQSLRGDFNVPALIVPVQALDRPVKLSDGFDWYEGEVLRSGKVHGLVRLG